MDPYDYAHRSGIEPISWERFESLTRALAIEIDRYTPELILGIARGGLFPATLLSCLLRRELYPIRLTRRYEDEVVRREPAWVMRPPDKVRGRRVLIVDEIADSGQTLAMASEAVRQMGAAEVRSAVLYAHTWSSPRPTYVALTTDALIINPWDREVLAGNEFVRHPEISEAIAAQEASTTAEGETQE